MRRRNVYRHDAGSGTHHRHRADDPDQLRARPGCRTHYDGRRLLRCRLRRLYFIDLGQCAWRSLDGCHVF